jgi:hypothetical protein
MSDKPLRPVPLRVPLRKGYYLLEKELVPARKVGKSWVTTEGELEDFLLGRPSTSEQEVVWSMPAQFAG